MSGNSSGSDYPGGGSSPEEIKQSVPEAGEGTEGKIDNACNSQAHSTTHCTQSETNQDLTGESDTPSSAQSQSKGEIIINDGKLADDNEKGEKNKVTPREQDKVVHYAMQRAQNDNQFSNNYQDENFCAEKGRGLIVATVADQCEQYNSSRNAQADEVSTENFEKNGKHMVEEAAADVDHKIETGEHTSYENNKQMDQEDEKRSASAKQTLDQRNDTPSKSESVHLNQGDGKPTTPQTASSLAKSLQSSTQTENRNQENGTPSTSQMENPIQGDGKPSSSQTENSNQGDGKPSSSQVINPNQGNGKPTTQQTENQNKENGTPSTSLMDIPNQGNGIPSTSQAKNPNKGNGIPSTPQTENPNEGDGKPSLSQTENSNQGGGKLSSTQANDPNQGDGTPSSSQTENPKEGDGKPSLSQTENSNQGDGKLSSTQANDPIQGDGTPSSSQTENPNQGDGTPSLSQTENPNQGDGTPSTSQTKNLNQEDSIPSTSQTENLNQENGTPSTSQTMNPNQGDGTPSISQTVSPNQEDSIPSISQTENPKQEDGIPSTSQTKNLNQGNGIPSVIGDRIHVNIDKGTSDNTEKGKNDRTSELDAGNLHKSDEDYRTTEEERQYAITKTQLSQSGIQVTEYANGQIEGGATCSEHPHIPFSFSQIQADFTIIEYQLEQVIDKILNDSTLHENKEEWKKNAKKEIMVFLLSIVKDGTLSRRSFHPCVTHSMPIQVFDSDIHVAGTSRKDAEGARAGERLSSSAHTRPYDPSIYTTKPHDNETCQQVPSDQTASDSPGKMYSKSLYGTSRKDAEGARAGERLSSSAHTRPYDALNPDKEVVTSQPEPIKNFADTTLPGNTKDKEKMCKHNVFFVLDPGRKLKDEEWGLEIECASPEFYKLLFSFSNENLTSFAKNEFQKMKISLSQTFSHHLGITCSCIKLSDQRKLDHLIIGAVVSVCYALLPFVHLTKVTIHPDLSFEQIKTFCFSRHDAFKKHTVQLFHNEKRSDEVWIAVENDVRDLGSAVVRDLLIEKKVTMITQKWEKYDFIGYFLQCAALNEMDALFLNLMKERYQDVNISSDGKRAVLYGQKEIDGDFLEKMRKDILALRKVRCSHAILSPSLKILLTYQEAVDFIDQTAHAKHNEPFFWTVTKQQGKTNLLEVYALNTSSANSALGILLRCLKQREFDDTQLHKEAFKFPALEGDKFRGKIAYIGMTNKTVQITGTEDIFDEYIDILLNESIRLKKPVCKTVPVNSSNILSYCETHFQDHFRKWKQCVDIEIIVGTNGTCGYTIKATSRNSEKIVEIANELKKIISDIREIQFEEEKNDIMDMSKTAEFRKQRCEVEKEWSVDTLVEGVPGQEWSIEDGFEWRFENGPSLTLLILKSALPAETDVVLQPFRKDNIPVGKQQRNIQIPLSRDWHKLEFEAEYGDIGKAKESLRKSLKTTLLSDVKGNHFQTLVFPVEQKIMEKIGWFINRYLKQILVVLQEDFISEPWSLYFLCGTKDELKTCAEILETNFKKRNISKTDVKIKSFPIEENGKPAITIEVRQGSLVETKADVIVNTTHKDLKSLKHGHVSKSILDAAGIELSTECRKKYPQGIKYCEVAVTPSFQLKQCKKIYHGGIPYFKESLAPLKDFVWNCLFQATEDNMQTIAFPAIGTGNLNYPKEGVAETMINTVHEFSDKCPTTLQSVFFVIFDDATLQEFKKRSTAKQTVAASNTQTPGVSKKVKITVVGIPDRAEAASNCLHDFIKEFKKKKEDGTTRKQDEAIQPSKFEENKGLEKSITDKETTSPSKLGNERENVSVHGESLRLILVKTASESDSSLTMSECRKHLNGFQYRKIICPFENDYSALVKFETQKDVDQVLSNIKNANYAFKNLPEQAVHNVKAKLSKEIIHVLKTKNVTEEEIENASGANLDKIEWLLTGHLLEIKQAAEVLKQIMSRDSEPRTLLDPTLPNKIPDAHTTDVYEKRKMYCSISEWAAIRYFYQDVASKLHYNPDLDGVRYWLFGKPEAIDEFSHALGSIFEMKLNNISRIMFDEIEPKHKGVYCYFVEEQNTLEIFAKSQEKLDFIKENLTNFNKKGSGKANTFDKQKSEYQTDKSITTGDDKNVENDVHLRMEADAFDTVCHFYKEFSAKFKRSDEKDQIILTGPKHLVKQFEIALKDIKDNYFNEVIVFDARWISRVQDVYASMTETDIHVRMGKSGSNNIIMLTGKNKHEVSKMKSWFEDELEKKKKNSRKKFEVKKRHSSLAQNDCLIFHEGKFKVYALKENILQVCADALVCPASVHVGDYIKMNAGIEDTIIVKTFDDTPITDAPKLDTCTMLIHTKVPRWSDYGRNKNPCEDCIEDIGSIVQRCLSAGSISSTIAFPEFFSDENCQLPALICCMGFARGVNKYFKDDPKSDLNIYYVDNNPDTTYLLQRCFRQEVNWEYIADDDHSIFFFCCKFQVHVKKADVFNSTADAIAVSQDPDMKNERFIAQNLYQMNDKRYQSALKGKKLSKRPIITIAPHHCGYVEVIHFVSPNWRNMKNKRDDQLKQHSESIQALLNEAKSNCSSVVIPLSGGHFTDWETRKEIAKGTATAVAEWCKGNAKRTQKLKTIYFLHDDSRYIKEMMECCRQHPCLKDQLIVVPPTSTYSTPV